MQPHHTSFAKNVRFPTLHSALILSTVLGLCSLSGYALGDENFPAMSPPPEIQINPEPPAEAPSPQTSKHEPKVETFYNEKVEGAGEGKGTKLSLFFGGSLGYSFLSTSSTEVGKNGVYLQGHGTAAWYTEKAVFDLGIGWLYSRVKGEGTIDGVKTRVTIITQAGTLEFSPRFRLGENFELGPIGEFIYGTDASFGEDSTQSSGQVLFGAKLAWAYLEKDLQWRWGFKLLTDITIRDRQVWMPMAFIELGFPLLKNKTIIREKETVRTEYVEKLIPIKGKNTFVFDDEFAHFEINKAELHAESKRFFYELGQYLAANPQVWTSIKVSGHTDITGSPDHNRDLSQRRAQAVGDIFRSAGVPSDRIQTEGFGSSAPVDPGNDPVALARNRRVEINFGEGASSADLHKEIKRIKLRTIKPRTCEGKRCK